MLKKFFIAISSLFIPPFVFSPPPPPPPPQVTDAFETTCRFMCAESEPIRANWIASMWFARIQVNK